MKFHAILALFLAFSWSQSRAQETRYEFIGTLQTTSDLKISIKLNFTIDANDSIHGISITDFFGENRTISRIAGTFNRESKELSFKELSNISTRSNADPGDFCYIEVQNLVLSTRSKEEVLAGTFIGRFLDGSACAEGTLNLIGAGILEKLETIAEVSEELTNTELPAQAERPTASDLRRAANPNAVLTHQEEMQFNCESDTLMLILWDSYEEDGDAVNVYVNGKLEFENLMVKERQQRFKIPFVGDQLELRVVGKKEGSNPPCTVNGQLKDGGFLQPFVAKLKVDEEVYLRIMK